MALPASGNTPFLFTNIRPLADGKPMGSADDVTLSLPAGEGTYRFLLDHLHSDGWDCNGVSYDSKHMG